MPNATKCFNSTINRSLELLALYERLRKVKLKKEPHRFSHNDLSDLLRSAVALSVSAMDSYFTTKFAEIFVRYVKRHGLTEGLSEMLIKAGLTPDKALELINMKRPYRGLRNMIETHLERTVTQRFEYIDKLFINFELSALCENASRKSKKKHLLSSVEKLVKRRHAIVHQGDLNRHGKLTRITFDETQRRIDDLVTFVSNCDDIINNKIE